MPSEGHKRTGRPRGRPRSAYGDDRITVRLSARMTRELERFAEDFGGDPARMTRGQLIRLGLRMLMDSPRDVLIAQLADPRVATVVYRVRGDEGPEVEP